MVKKLYGGEYDPAKFSTEEARRLFLKAIQEIAPHVLQSLKEDVLPLCDELKILTWFTVKHSKTATELKASLEAWAGSHGTDQFNLRHDWILKAALRTLGAWQKAPSLAELDPLQWAPRTTGYWPGAVIPAEEQALHIQRPVWHPAEETRAQFRERVIANLDRYLGKLESIAREQELNKYKELRKEDKFLWLAMYWVCDYDTFSDIGRAVDQTGQAVSLEIKSAAEKCGLPIPEGEAG